MNAEEEEIEKSELIKDWIRMHISMDPTIDAAEQEYELNNAARSIWNHVIVPMCRT